MRPERAGDRLAVRALLEAAFPGPDEARLVDALRAADELALALVAESAGAIVGFVAFSPVVTARGERGLGLAPLAVDAAHRRRGIGARLVEEGLAACAALGAGFVVVLGEPSYYARFGFRPAPALGLHDAYGGGDAFQVLELRPGALPRGAGLVRYASAFGALEG